MNYLTYGEIKDKVERALDLEGEVFIEPEEMLDYANEAKDEASAEIHAIYEDYFLTYANIALVTAQELYDFPSNIYANKIRAIVYDVGETTYSLKRARYSDQFERHALVNKYASTDFYQYLIVNLSAAAKPQLLLLPKSRETGVNLKCWFLREANALVDDDSICDIPEFYKFIVQYMKVKCYEKEGHPNLEYARGELESERKLMVETLQTMVVDGDTAIEMDLSAYAEAT